MAMNNSLQHVFHQLKAKSRPAVFVFTRTIKMPVGLKKRNSIVYNMRTRGSHQSNPQDYNGLLTSRHIIQSHFDFTSVRQVSHKNNILMVQQLEIKVLNRELAEIITTALDQQSKQMTTIINQNIENEYKLQQLQMKIDHRFDLLNIKLDLFKYLALRYAIVIVIILVYILILLLMLFYETFNKKKSCTKP